MKPRIQERAFELGFDDCRITSAEAPTHAAQFQDWIKEGRHGAMGYLERNAFKRVDPQQVLPGARSILVLAASYHYSGGKNGSPAEQTPSSLRQGPDPAITRTAPVRPRSALSTSSFDDNAPALTGTVARYAQHADYHDVLAERLKSLADFINQQGGPETRSLWYVDTGPLLERDLAQRAGLGFAGKHTNLISRSFGNYFFLAEIITTLDLTPDEPEKNRCGSCARCIAACPTGAITAPFQLDARRCISYLTIELKGPIPEEFRPAIGNRIYGCDACLEVCPWNRFAREGRIMRKHRRDDLEQPKLLELLALDDAGFKARFAGTPMLRTKRRGLLRNVCVAIGNTGDARALPALQKAALDQEPLIVEHARWAIQQITERAKSGAALPPSTE